MTQGSPPGHMDSIREPVREECEALEGYFKSYLRTDVLLIDRIFEHLIDGGGKRFRPLLVLLVSSCSPHRVKEDIFKLADVIPAPILDPPAVARRQAYPRKVLFG